MRPHCDGHVHAYVNELPVIQHKYGTATTVLNNAFQLVTFLRLQEITNSESLRCHKTPLLLLTQLRIEILCKIIEVENSVVEYYESVENECKM